MDKVRIDKLDCYFSAFFKIMWISTVVWMVVGIANHFGKWLMPDKLDTFGLMILALFAFSIVVCFGKGIIDLLSKYEIMAINAVAKKVLSYVFTISFAVLLVITIWKFCQPTDVRAVSTRQAPLESVHVGITLLILADVIKATIIAVVMVLLYWYYRMCFVLLTGRIRRIGVVFALALVMVVVLSFCSNDLLWVKAIAVLIAAAFLFEIWGLASFVKLKDMSVARIKEVLTAEEEAQDDSEISD